MRLFEFIDINTIKANEFMSVDIQPEKIISYVEHHCGIFLNAARTSKRLLFRGLNDTNENVFVSRPREDRKTKGSTESFAKKLNRCFELVGLIPRNRTISCVSNTNTSNYGKLYIIFPLNGFNFSWSSKIPDVGSLTLFDVEEWRQYGEDDIANALVSLYNIKLEEINSKFAANVINLLGFKNHNLVHAMTKHNKISGQPNSYYEIAIAGNYVGINHEFAKNNATILSWLKLMGHFD